jgi:hypothetical protein
MIRIMPNIVLTATGFIMENWKKMLTVLFYTVLYVLLLAFLFLHPFWPETPNPNRCNLKSENTTPKSSKKDSFSMESSDCFFFNYYSWS